MLPGNLVAVYRIWYMLGSADEPLRWIAGTLGTPPLGREARFAAGTLLRRLQRGEVLSMPYSRPIPRIGRSVHELRVDDRETNRSWRIIYRFDRDAIVIVYWFDKKSRAIPGHVVDLCRMRLERYDRG
jgi:phage-related protein